MLVISDLGRENVLLFLSMKCNTGHRNSTHVNLKCRSRISYIVLERHLAGMIYKDPSKNQELVIFEVDKTFVKSIRETNNRGLRSAVCSIISSVRPSLRLRCYGPGAL